MATITKQDVDEAGWTYEKAMTAAIDAMVDLRAKEIVLDTGCLSFPMVMKVKLSDLMHVKYGPVFIHPSLEDRVFARAKEITES
jgi:hypothetical protein